MKHPLVIVVLGTALTRHPQGTLAIVKSECGKLTAVLRSIGPRGKKHIEAFKPRRGGDASRDAVW